MENVTKTTSVYERLYCFFAYVTKEKKMMSVDEFYSRTGITNGYFRAGNKKNKDNNNGIGTRKSDVNVGTILKVLNVFKNANLDYFVHGNGGMFIEEARQYENKVVVVSDNPKSGIPYYDVDFRGGFEELENCTTSLPSSYIDIEGYNKEGNMWCNISGHSMHPVIQSGDKICIREVNSIDSIIYGDIYAIVTNEMRTVKYIVRSQEEGCVRLVPENKDPHFGDYQDIRKDSIIKVFKVLGSIHLF